MPHFLAQAQNAPLALQVIQERGRLNFSLENVQLRERGENAYVVEGLVMGRSEEAGGRKGDEAHQHQQEEGTERGPARCGRPAAGIVSYARRVTHT